MDLHRPISEARINTAICISTATQFREAISRLRFLERSATHSSLGRERAVLELAISRYLATREQDAPHSIAAGT